MAKTPLPTPLGLPGTYALIHGHGCIEGYSVIVGPTSGWFPGEEEVHIYKVHGDVTKMTKRRLESWLRKAYPQRFLALPA